MTAASLWLRIGASGALALALGGFASPEPPEALVPSDRVGLGVAVGVALFAALSRIRLPLPLPTLLVLTLLAGAEEVVWRWFALGELRAAAGALAALVATACAFGVAHPGRRLQQTVTGLAFGGVYLVTGSLVAAWGAHAAYNVCVAVSALRAPREVA